MIVKALAVGVVLIVLTISMMEPGFATDQPITHIYQMYEHPFFWDVTATSAVGWFLGILKGFNGSAEWLKRNGVKQPSVLLVIILDALIFVGIGGYFGTAIYNPATLHAAMAAGLSWPIGLGALATK